MAFLAYLISQVVLPNSLLLVMPGKRVDEGIASLYYPWKKSATVPNARYIGNWYVDPTPSDLVCAHRTIPIGTIIRLRHKSRVAVCVVFDRGPFGFCERAAGKRGRHRRCPSGYRYVVNVSGNGNGWYRGVIDATPEVHRMLGTRGWVRVTVEEVVGLARIRHVLRSSVPGNV